MSDNDDIEYPADNRKAVDKETVDTANALLDSLEQIHRSDLTLHLYSSFLLKHLLYKANEKKHWFEVDQYVRTQIKHNWTSWPSPKTVINPQTNLLYEDNLLDPQCEGEKILTLSEKTSKQGEVSPQALFRSTNMLQLELNSFWQHCLVQSSSISGEVLNIDSMEIPKSISLGVIEKLDHFFQGLHNKVASLNKIEIQQDQISNHVTVSQLQNEIVKPRKAPLLTYHDIVSQGCEMNEDMVEIYMKSLELFSDIPSKMRRSHYKLPKSVLKKYRPAKKGKSGINVLKRSRESFLNINKLFRDKRLSAQDKMELRKLTKREVESGINKKTFFKVQSQQGDEDERDEYNLDDCLARIPLK